MLPIISSQQLNNVLPENPIILDVRTGKDAYENYVKRHIKGALFIDLDKDLSDDVKDPAFGGRHPLPHLEKFAEVLSNFGISSDSHVVVYDDKHGANAAARAWWMLKSFGIKKVQLLDGGIQDAENVGLEFSAGEENFQTSKLINNKWIFPISTLEDVENELKNKTAIVVDVRDAYRFKGESEPIDKVAGHIPGAINIPFSENLDKNGKFLKPEILKEKYLKILESRPKKLIVHCGSGVTACHTIFALHYAGFDIPSLYVGSWSEWSRREGKEVAVDV